MNHAKLQGWPSSKNEAHRIQREMAKQVSLSPEADSPRLIAAVDSAYGHGGGILYVSAVVTTFPDIVEIERTSHFGPVGFPYVPGLLFFREGPVMVKALAKIQNDVDLIIVHGHGIAHSQRCGMASHVGILFDRPALGCCRKLLVGTHREVSPAKGSWQPIRHRGERIGTAYRSKDNVKPIYISPAYKCGMDQAVAIVVSNLRGYRLPEPLRLAHLKANKFKRHIENKGRRTSRHTPV